MALPLGIFESAGNHFCLSSNAHGTLGTLGTLRVRGPLGIFYALPQMRQVRPHSTWPFLPFVKKTPPFNCEVRTGFHCSIGTWWVCLFVCSISCLLVGGLLITDCETRREPIQLTGHLQKRTSLRYRVGICFTATRVELAAVAVPPWFWWPWAVSFLMRRNFVFIFYDFVFERAWHRAACIRHS